MKPDSYRRKIARSIVRQIASMGRWTALALLLLLTLGYLTSGLSGAPNQPPAGSSPPSTLGMDQTAVAEPKTSDPVARSIAQVDQAREQSLAAAGLQAAPPADWMMICRRLSLALVGSGMSVEEIRDLQRLPAAKRESAHLERLLEDARFHDYWGERYTRFLVGADEGPFIVYRRRRFQTWLSDAFAQNWRYDRMVRELITAEGLWTDRPEVNFYTVTFDSGEGKPDPIRMTARTARVFLGLRIDCLQCHDDFLGNVNLGDADQPREGLQQDFHQLAAFFTAAKFNGLQGIRNGRSDYRYQYLDADEEVDVQPAVPFAAELLPSEGNPRRRLAAWITHPDNRQAARAAVSHVWALIFGRPAGDAVDNLPLDEVTTPMLETLTDDFIMHRFDIRHLIRVICGSAAFRASSQADFEITPMHEQLGAVFPLIRLRPEQVAGCLLQSARIKQTDRESSLLVQFQTFTQTNDFIRRYGDLGEDEFTTDSVTITQRLLTMNGRLLRESIEDNPFLNASTHIAMFARDDHQAVEAVYLSVLNRLPDEAERDFFVARLNHAKNRRDAIEDLFWVLLNSTELAWNH